LSDALESPIRKKEAGCESKYFWKKLLKVLFGNKKGFTFALPKRAENGDGLVG
jgi:hypothetical protein